MDFNHTFQAEGRWAGEWERESLFATNKEQRYKNILNITTVAGYQKGIPIKLG